MIIEFGCVFVNVFEIIKFRSKCIFGSNNQQFTVCFKKNLRRGALRSGFSEKILQDSREMGFNSINIRSEVWRRPTTQRKNA